MVGEITIVNNPRKNKVAFGFKTFVKEPSRNAVFQEISGSDSTVHISIFHDHLLNKAVNHNHNKYQAPSIFIAVYTTIDWEISKANHNAQYKTWTVIPNQNQTAVQIHVFLEYISEFFTATTKSGPGLITAKKCTHKIQNNTANQVIIINKI